MPLPLPTDNRKHVVVALKCLVAVSLLAALFHFDILNFAELSRLTDAPVAVATAILLAIVSTFIASLRWWILTRTQSINATFGRILRINFIGIFANWFLPGGIGGDVVRAAYIARSSPQARSAAVMSVIVDRYCGLMGLIAIATGVCLLRYHVIASNPGLSAIAVMVGAMFAAGIVLFAGGIWFSDYLHRSGFLESYKRGWPGFDVLSRIISALAAYRLHGRLILTAWLLSLLVHGFSIVALIIIAAAILPETLSGADLAIAAPISLFMNSLPITPGGIGVGEGAFDTICRMLAGNEDGTPYGNVFLGYRAASIIASLPAIFLYIKYRGNIAETVSGADRSDAF